MTLRFRNKTVVITGAASGLGRGVASALRREGATRILMLDRDAERLHAAAEELGPAAKACHCDVADPRAVAESLSDAALPDGLDILVTAAGVIGPGGTASDFTPQEWEEVFAINVHGTYHAIHYSIPYMRSSGGTIITFGSVAGLAGSATRVAYSATKGAVIMLTRSLALAHAKDGIRVNCVCPGPIPTPLAEASWSLSGSQAEYEARRSTALSRTPSGRFGTIEEVAETVLFLASDAAAHITGVSLPIDGGRLA